MNTTKEEIREFFRKKRREISVSQREEFSEKICKNLSEIIQKKYFSEISGYIALFAGTKEEPDLVGNSHGCSLRKKTHSLQEKFPDRKFCFPKIDESGKNMNFFKVQKISDLEIGNFGILEPRNFCPLVEPHEIELFCIPFFLSLERNFSVWGE